MRKTALPLIIGIACLGAVSVWPGAERPATNRTNAPVLQTLSAPPLEEVITHVIAQGETLSGVLSSASVVGQDLVDALLVLREHQNPRLLSKGAEVTVHKWTSTGAPRSVEVRLNADTTVILAKGELGWNSRLVLTPTVVDTVYVAGKIDKGRSLYESIFRDETINLPVRERDQLAENLGDIYQYTIDFSHEIKPGDSYQIAYEREARPDGTARNRRILIAEIINGGKQLSAVYFKHGGIEGYYSKDGRSLREGFRKSPLDFTRVTSNFDWHRYHPILGMYRAHLGTDYGAASGTKVHAVADGVVASAGNGNGYGNVVVIRHFDGYTTRYAHLRSFASGIRAGKRVQQDQVIGYVGSSGLATGPHLHFELRRNGQPTDFRKARLPGAPPIPGEYRGEFRQLVTERLALLEEAMSPKLASKVNSGGSSGGL
jgi:murein DD-endopeptidase MepM/ murein hydrolase activator NlpD